MKLSEDCHNSLALEVPCDGGLPFVALGLCVNIILFAVTGTLLAAQYIVYADHSVFY